MRTPSLFFAFSAIIGAIASPAEETSTQAAEVSAASTCRNPECLARKPHTSALKPTYPRSNIPNVTEDSSYYDDMIYIHMDQTDQIHYTGLFLPWHRWFVNEHVQQLKAQCGYKGVMPYWGK
ncbi:hypothetical protein RSAG8_05398, partial [Rhizoctonia solani AG-8 WAC10335]